MGTGVYLLLSGDGNETKISYRLNLGIWMNFFFRDWYRKVKLISAHLVVAPKTSMSQPSTMTTLSQPLA